MARRLRRTAALGAIFFLFAATAERGVRILWAAAAPRAAAESPIVHGTGGSAVSPAALIGAIQLSLESVHLPPGTTPLPLPATLPDSHGLSPANWAKLIRLIARAHSEHIPRPVLPASASALGAVSEEQALDALRAINTMLEGASSESLDNPHEIGILYQRLWDGLQSSPPSFAAPPRRDSQRHWQRHRETILNDVEILRSKLSRYASQQEEAIGVRAFEQELDKSKVSVQEPGLGKAVMTTVDRRRIIRVVHAPTELSLLLIDESAVSKNSRHLRRLIGRQFFDAGTERPDGRNGRATIVLWQREGAIASIEFHEKPRFWSRRWWKSYWDATYKTPDGSDMVFGITMGLLQGALALGLGELKSSMLGTPLEWTPIVFTMGFGFFICTFVSTYTNWTYRGSKISQFLKSALISLAFAYPVIISTQGLGAVALTSSGLLMHAHVFSNVALNNMGKVAWQQIPVIGEKHRQFTGKLFWKIKKSAMVNQGFYTINWTLRLADLLGIPGGRLIFLAGLPLAMIISYWYARRHGFPEAAHMRELPARLYRRCCALMASARPRG